MSSLYYKQVALAQERGAHRFEYSAIALLKAAHFPQMTIKNDDLNRLEERLNGLEDAYCAELKSLHDEIDSQLAKSMSGKNRLELMLFKALILSRQHQKEEALKVRTQILKEIDDQLAKNMSKRKFQVWKGDSLNGKLEDYSIDVDKGMVVLDVVHVIQKLRHLI